jgi:hypothetical protein
MRFSELIKKWEGGWRGIAVDSKGCRWKFTGSTMFFIYGCRDGITDVDEIWTICNESEEKI